MMGYPLFPPFLPFFDNAGAPLAGGLIETYEAGTDDELETYSDPALTTPNTNPVVLNAYGRASIYVASGVPYKVIVKTSLGVTIATEDGLEVPEVEAAVAAGEIPPGSIAFYLGLTAPTGWLLCDGTPYSRATYAALFAAIATRGGPGNGSSTFNVPDMRGRFPFGAATAGTGSTMGGTFGTIDHVHTGPSHTHPIPAHTHTVPGHTHAIPYNGWTTAENTPPTAGALQAGGSGVGSESAASQATANQDSGTSTAQTTSANTVGLVTDAGGTGNTGTANPPALAGNWIIKI
jgi:microcystin-dependent protein